MAYNFINVTVLFLMYSVFSLVSMSHSSSSINAANFSISHLQLLTFQE